MDLIPHNLPSEYETLRRVTPEEIDLLKEMTRDQRVAICKNDYALFSSYYFAHTKKYAFALFHYDFFASFRMLTAGLIEELMLLAFRESAKTSLVKEYVIHQIAYQEEDYIVWDSYDGGNSKRALFDIVVELQTNKRIKQDFGELYNAKRNMDEVTQKSVSDFVTNPTRDEYGDIKKPGIRVEAHSTQEPARGFLHAGKRPGLVILDDFENKKTVRSEAMTLSIWEHMQELKGGVDSAKSKIIFLANYISQFANVQKILDREKMDPLLKIHKVAVIENGIPTWFEKYTLTDAEAEAYKQMYPQYAPKVSLETKKRKLWSPDTGDQDWEAEMMSNPIDNSLATFKREYFQYINLTDVLKKDVVCFVILDPALSEKDTSDDTGVSIIWTDKENNWYSKVFPVRINSKELVDFLFDVYQTLSALGTPPRRIGIEKEKYFGAVFPFLREKMKEKRIFLPMYAIDIKGRNKQDRITNALQYRYEVKVIWHVVGEINLGKVTAPMLMTDYETQAQRFPAGGHDDMLDSHAYGADIVRYDAPESEEEKKNKQLQSRNPYNMDAFVERIQRENRQNGMSENEREEMEQYKSVYGDDEDGDVDNYYDEIGG